MEIIAVYAAKGGVGKTTIAYNLSYFLSQKNFKVLIVDFDSQCDLTNLLVNPNNFEFNSSTIFKQRNFDIKHAIQSTKNKNLFILTGDSDIDIAGAFNVKKSFREATLSQALKSVVNIYDYVIVDCPPTRSEIPVNALYAANKIITPIELDGFSEESVTRVIELVMELKSINNFKEFIRERYVTFFINKYDSRTSLLNTKINKILDDIKPLMLNVPARNRVDVKNSILNHQTIFEYSKKSDAAKDFFTIFEGLFDHEYS